MKILLNATGAVAGGINRLLVALAGALAHDHQVAVADAPGGTKPALRDAGVAVSSTQSASRARTVAAAVRRPREDCDLMIDVAPSLARHPRRGRLVTVVNDLGYRNNPAIDITRAQRWYRQRALAQRVRDGDLLVCISEHTRRELTEAFPAAARRATVIYPSVDHLREPSGPPIRPDRGRDRRALELIMFGHGRNKGVDLALSALRVRSDVALTVFARRAQLESFGYGEAMAAAFAAGRLCVVEDAGDDEVSRRIVGADVFIMPSAYEGFGLPAAEAMWLGAPTVVSGSPALGEATRGGAVVMRELSPHALLRAADEARRRPDQDWSQAREAIRRWTWADFTSSLLNRLDGAPSADLPHAP